MARRHSRRGGGDRDDNDGRDVIEAIEDVAIYPVLTDSVTLPQAPSGGGGPGLPITQTAETAIRQVLGWKYRDGDAKGVMQALTNSFTVTEEEGHTVVTWTPRSYAAVVSADLGEVTGAQASIYARAKVALDQILPLLDGLKGLRPDFDKPQGAAMRAIVRTEVIELVAELGTVGGPRVQRINELFKLLGGRPWDVGNGGQGAAFDTVKGHLNVVRERFGLETFFVNTIDDEKDLTNFVMAVDYLNGLYLGWLQEKKFFEGGRGEAFLGTQLVLISRALAVVAETVQSLYFAMDSVYLSAAERAVVPLRFGSGHPTLTLAEFLTWVERFSAVEAQELINEGGKDGVVAFRNTLQLLHELAVLAQPARQTGPDVPRAFQTPRVKRAMEELEAQLDDALELARRINRGPAPIVTVAVGSWKGRTVRVDIVGANFQEGADAELLLSDAPTYEVAVASDPQIVRPLHGPTISGTTSAFAEFRIPHSSATALPPSPTAQKTLAEKDKAYVDALAARDTARTNLEKARAAYEKALAADPNQADYQGVRDAEQRLRQAKEGVAAAWREKELAAREAVHERLEYGKAFVRLINPDGQSGSGPLEIPPQPASEVDFDTILSSQD